MNLASLLLASAASHGDGFQFHHGLIIGSTVIVVLVLVLLAIVARGQVGVVPTGFAAAFEHVFDWIDGMADDMIPGAGRKYVPLLMSMFLFVLFSNWSGLLPLPVLTYTPDTHVAASGGHGSDHGEVAGEAAAHATHLVMFEAPTASYNTTLALALISFFAFNLFGIWKCLFPGSGHGHHEGDEHAEHGGFNPAGIGDWIAHFWQPTPMLWNSLEGGMKMLCIPLFFLFLCLNILEEVARILSLSIRLFGNISGEHQVKVNLLSVLFGFLGSSLNAFKQGSLLVGPGWLLMAAMIWGASIFTTLLGALAGFIQAMIFFTLSLVYISHAVADEH